MEHENIKQLISKEFDGEATTSEKELIALHTANCVSCLKYKKSLNQLSTVLESWGEEELSPDAHNKIVREMKEVASVKEEIKMKPKNRLVKFGFGGGVVVTMIIAVLTLQVYVKRGTQGRLKSAADDIGQQFSTGHKSAVQLASVSEKVDALMNDQRVNQYAAGDAQRLAMSKGVGSSKQYEPYYLETDYSVDKSAAVQPRSAAPGVVPMRESFEVAQSEVTRTRADAGKQMRSMGGAQVSSYDPSLSGTVGGINGQGQNNNAPGMPGYSEGRKELADKDGYAKAKEEFARANNAEYWGGPVSDEVEYLPTEPTVRTNMPYPEIRPDVYQRNTEEYQPIYENYFQDPLSNPLSTFSIDVDTASYSNVRRYLTNNQLPPVNAVRIEELVNYFSYDYPKPMFNQPFSITTNASRAPWNPAHYLVQIGIQGKTLGERQVPPSNLVFLIDVSGSMNQPNKLPLLKQSLSMMVGQLGPNERVAIVTYAGNAGLALNSTPGSNKHVILNAINNLQAGGSTAGAQGIRLAYQIARQNLIQNGNNRVILATDGDFNVGVSSDNELVSLIEQERNSGIFLSVLGFGTGNLKDGKMEQIANKGNGNYFYIDNITEGEKVLVHELGSTLFTIAKDVKIQVEFNPKEVAYYKLIGYEDRLLRKEDFNNDAVDAGELGAGHTVTALYEIVPAGFQANGGSNPLVDPLKYQGQSTVSFFNNADIMTVKLRYKEPDGTTSKLLKKTIKKNQITDQPKGELRFAAAVAEFGMLLRHSPTKGYASYDRVILNARSAIGRDSNGYRAEFIHLAEQAKRLDAQNYSYPLPYQGSSGYEDNNERNSGIQFKGIQSGL